MLTTFLTPEQFRAVIAELKLPYNLMVRVAVACAFRPSELMALRWRDLDVAERLFRIREMVYRGEIRPYTKTAEPDERKGQSQLLGQKRVRGHCVFAAPSKVNFASEAPEDFYEGCSALCIW